VLRARARRALGFSAALTCVLIGLIGFAHTPAGRPILRALGRVASGAGCPLGYDKAQGPAERERARASFARGHRGSVEAPLRPALGFALDRSTRAEVTAFMAGAGVACRESTGMADLVCGKVPSRALPSEFRNVERRELWFNFGDQGRLIALTAISRDHAAEPISTAFGQVIADVARKSGPAARLSGDASARALASGALQQASAEFRFANYYALTRVTNMGKDFLLTEEYRSLPN
jgi:hypothetical protein